MSVGKNKFTWNNPLVREETVTIHFEGEICEVPNGITVAAALFGHEVDHFCKSAAEDEKRSPYCMMGLCFECLVEIDGQKNRQACLEPVYEGMYVKRQHVMVDEKK